MTCAWEGCAAACGLRNGRRVSYCDEHAARVYRATKPFKLNGRAFNQERYGEGIPVSSVAQRAIPSHEASRLTAEQEAQREARRAVGLSDFQEPEME